MRRMLLSLLTIVVTVYLALAALLYAFQPRFIYFPSTEVQTTPAAVGLAYEDVALETGDGVRLHGWLVPAPRARASVVFLHGNAGNVAHRLETLTALHELGLTTLIIDYRGYGRSAGRPSERGTYADASAAWRYLVEQRGVPPGRVIAHGRSLGGAVAVWLAAHRPVGGLVVESSFTSIADLARHYYPFLPTALLTRVRYPSAKRIARVSCPVLVMHGRGDGIVPFALGRRLFEAAGEPKRFVELDGGHNDAFVVDGQRYRRALRAFLDEITRDPPSN